MSRIRIVLADDHTIVRNGLRALLERNSKLMVVGEAGSGREVIEIVEQELPDVVLMDVGMPLLNGIDATAKVTSLWPKIAVIILSMHSDESYLLRALKAGARGYLLKDSAESDLTNAILAVVSGKAFFSPAVSRVLADDYIRQVQQRGIEDPYDLLTAREREIVQLIAEGKSSKDIASLLGLSTYTVDTHRGNLMQKLNVHSLPELILYAVRRGIIS
jgi:DNA-binding NarL/FixJ family response regulator